MNEFDDETSTRIKSLQSNSKLKHIASEFMLASISEKYSYNFRWMGRPIIQYPQDMVAMQEIIWEVKPDLVIETGIAHGGSLVYYASLCEMIGHGRVVGIDIDIRPNNRAAIEAHPMYKRITMLQGSSIDPVVIDQVRALAKGKRVVVVLDSNHTHDHVLAELRAYASLVSIGSYCVVFDTIVEDLPAGMYPERPWDVGNNPKTAAHAFLQENADFEIDREIESKIQISVAPDGYLRRIR